jgi:hypothetical protein
LFSDGPWADAASTLTDDIKRAISDLDSRGMAQTAAAVTEIINTLILGSLELSATAQLDGTDEVALAMSMADLMTGLLDSQEDLLSRFPEVRAELTEVAGGDRITATDLMEPRSVIVEQEATLRAFLYESGASGEGWSNGLLSIAQGAREKASQDLSIAEMMDELQATFSTFGTFDPERRDVFPMLDAWKAAHPPPPGGIDTDSVCLGMAVLGILLLPFSLGTGLASAATPADALFELIFAKLSNGATVSSLVADGTIESDTCSAFSVVFQIVSQLFQALMALGGMLMCIVALSGGLGLLMGLIIALAALVNLGQIVCAFIALVDSMQAVGDECGRY